MFRRINWVAIFAVALFELHVSAPSYGAQFTKVSSVDGWTIKSRVKADNKARVCAMERFFQAKKGAGRLRLTIIAWPTSVIVILRGKDGFLNGKGVGSFDIVSSERQLFSGRIRYENSEVLFALNGADNRRHVSNSSGWSISMNGKRLARFPMAGAAAAMAAVENCAGLDQQIAATSPTPQPDDHTLNGLEFDATGRASISIPGAAPALAGKNELVAIAQKFSDRVGRPKLRLSGLKSGILHWNYRDDVTSAAVTVTQQPASAAAFAASLAIRADQCTDSVLTLPMHMRDIVRGQHAAVVSMCRGPDSVLVRHVHVATLGGGATYVLNLETVAGIDGRGIPEKSDALSEAFLAAVAAGAGG